MACDQQLKIILEKWLLWGKNDPFGQKFSFVWLGVKECKERAVIRGTPLGFYWRWQVDSFLKCS